MLRGHVRYDAPLPPPNLPGVAATADDACQAASEFRLRPPVQPAYQRQWMSVKVPLDHLRSRSRSGLTENAHRRIPHGLRQLLLSRLELRQPTGRNAEQRGKDVLLESCRNSPRPQNSTRRARICQIGALAARYGTDVRRLS
jgi:hypothetical protein